MIGIERVSVGWIRGRIVVGTKGSSSRHGGSGTKYAMRMRQGANMPVGEAHIVGLESLVGIMMVCFSWMMKWGWVGGKRTLPACEAS